MLWIFDITNPKKLGILGMMKHPKSGQEILEKYLGEPCLLHKQHIDILTRYHSSCWFVAHLLGKYLNEYDIIIHPSSWHNELLAVREKIPAGKKVTVQFSKLRFANK